jgi:hypothetical protein
MSEVLVMLPSDVIAGAICCAIGVPIQELPKCSVSEITPRLCCLFRAVKLGSYE